MVFDQKDLVKNPEADGDEPCRLDGCLWKALNGVFGTLPYLSVTEENKMKCKHCGQKVHYMCLYAYASSRMSEMWCYTGNKWKEEKELAENVMTC